jgi:hypothetical protein
MENEGIVIQALIAKNFTSLIITFPQSFSLLFDGIINHYLPCFLSLMLSYIEEIVCGLYFLNYEI